MIQDGYNGYYLNAFFLSISVFSLSAGCVGCQWHAFYQWRHLHWTDRDYSKGDRKNL
jgi:hypothetical protein